jgi:adenosylcobinamide-GDP ribazoletransferase
VGRDAEHRLSIMRDSRIGAFGAVGLILFLLLEIAAVVGLPPGVRGRALLVLPAIARATPPLLAACFRPAKADGHGAAFRAGLRTGAAPVALVPVLVLAGAVLGIAGLVVAAAAVVAALALAGFMAARLGGVTGDVLGAAIEVAELAGLLTVSAWMHARP